MSLGSPIDSYWKGCVSSLTFSNQLISTHMLPAGVTQTKRNVISGCHGDNQCASADVCSANADCVDDWNSFRCLCKPGESTYVYSVEMSMGYWLFVRVVRMKKVEKRVIVKL